MTATGILTVVASAKRLRESVALVAICAMLTSCAMPIAYNDFDTSGGPSRDEYEGLIGRRGAEAAGPAGAAAAGTEPPIPGFQSVIAAPSAPELADTRRVSIAVTETVPVRDVLIELARRGGVDLELDPRISGGIIMTATDRPFGEVIGRIADLAELRYRMERNTLRVEVDDPYLEQYRMDILNLTRSSTSSTASSTDASSVAQALGSGGGGGGNNQSSTNVSMSTTSDFWSTIGTNIQQILSGIQSRRGAAISADAAYVPQAEEGSPAAATNAAPGAKPAPAPAAGGGGGAGAGLAQQAAAINQSRQGQLEENLAADQAQPDGAPALAAAAGAGGGNAASLGSSNFTINPEAGIITVLATQRQHVAVERYLREVRNSVTQQILIEAKVVEIALSDQYRAGVDWDAVFGPAGQALTVGTNFSRNVVPPTFSNPTLIADWTNAGGDLSLAVQLVKEFGVVRTLSSPRLTALNNQVAQLKVAQNQVFFELDVQFTEATQQGQRDKITVSSQIKTVPVGFIMSVQPVVDPTTRRISISLRPSITRITGFVNDPGVAVAVGLAQQANPQTPNISSPIPIIEVREMDSLITMESGQTVVMGGLMQEDVQTTREGLPGLMDIPLLGQAVAQNVKQNKVTELVIFIRATLTNDSGTIADEDIRLYKRFTPDPRPIVF